MPKLVVNYPNLAAGTNVEVQGYGVFKNGTVNEVDGPLYQNQGITYKNEDGVDAIRFEDVEVDTLVLGVPLDFSNPTPQPFASDLDVEGDN